MVVVRHYERPVIFIPFCFEPCHRPVETVSESQGYDDNPNFA
jgi:hypothetical protein